MFEGDGEMGQIFELRSSPRTFSLFLIPDSDFHFSSCFLNQAKGEPISHQRACKSYSFLSNVIEPIVPVEKKLGSRLASAAAAGCNQATQTESQTSHRHRFWNCFGAHGEVLEVCVVAVTAIVEGD